LPSRNLERSTVTSPPSDWRVPLSEPFYSAREVEAVAATLRGGWWTMGPETQLLESEMCRFLGVKHAIAVSSGTAALHIALLALGVKGGTEVLTPSLTFVAAANVILHSGGVPRFVDVESETSPLVSVSNLESSLTPATRGIIVMHYGGYPCGMPEIMKWAGERGLWVIEDAAHAPGVSIGGSMCGSFGDIGCFSFFGNKNISCAEGGLVVTQRDDLANSIRALRSHGMDSLTWDRYRKDRISYDVLRPGFNYRIDDLRASLLRIQLQALTGIKERRRMKVLQYRDRLRHNNHWTIPFLGADTDSAYHLFVIVLDKGISREKLMCYLMDRGVQTSIHYPPVHLFSCYREFHLGHAGLAVTESLGRRLVTLPLFPGMSEGQVDLVCEALQAAVAA
jgi:dTDP-4-amino-4,6-dideoxygalactose transaminase